MSGNKKKEPKKKPSQEKWKPDKSQTETVQLVKDEPKKKKKK